MEFYHEKTCKETLKALRDDFCDSVILDGFLRVLREDARQIGASEAKKTLFRELKKICRFMEDNYL